jgi:hypothetical protein
MEGDADKANGQQLDNSGTYRIALVGPGGRMRTVTIDKDKFRAAWEKRARSGRYNNCVIDANAPIPIAVEFGKLLPEQMAVAVQHMLSAKETALHSRSKVAALHLTFIGEGEALHQQLIAMPEDLDGSKMSLVGIIHSDGSVTVRPTADLIQEQLRHLLENQTDHWCATWGHVIDNAIQALAGRGRKRRVDAALEYYDQEVARGRLVTRELKHEACEVAKCSMYTLNDALRKRNGRN